MSTSPLFPNPHLPLGQAGTVCRLHLASNLVIALLRGDMARTDQDRAHSPFDTKETARACPKVVRCATILALQPEALLCHAYCSSGRRLDALQDHGLGITLCRHEVHSSIHPSDERVLEAISCLGGHNSGHTKDLKKLPSFAETRKVTEKSAT
jgi:hypothetical protein